MREGDVVLVLGKIDERVRENAKDQIVIGTLVTMSKDEVSVLLTNGDLWHGLKREVVPYLEQFANLSDQA